MDIKMEVAKEIKKHILILCLIANTHEKLAKHLNIDQIYIDRKAFLVESKGASIGEVVIKPCTNLFGETTVAQ